MGKKVYEDDDQRVIADMSDVSHRAPRFHARTQSISDASDSQPKQSPFSSEERRLYVFAALKAALLIGLAFLGGLGLVIWLITLL